MLAVQHMHFVGRSQGLVRHRVLLAEFVIGKILALASEVLRDDLSRRAVVSPRKMVTHWLLSIVVN